MKTYFFTFLAIVGFLVGVSTARAVPVTVEWDLPISDCAGNALEAPLGPTEIYFSESPIPTGGICTAPPDEPPADAIVVWVAPGETQVEIDSDAVGLNAGVLYFVRMRVSRTTASELWSNFSEEKRFTLPASPRRPVNLRLSY